MKFAKRGGGNMKSDFKGVYKPVGGIKMSSENIIIHFLK